MNRSKDEGVSGTASSSLTPPAVCVEVPCLVNKYGIQPCKQPLLPEQLAAMNRNNINVQLLTIEAHKGWLPKYH